jgi:hypothetical protein
LKEEGRRKRSIPMRANVSVGAKHDRIQSLLLTNNISAGMLRPYYKIGMLSKEEGRGKREEGK